MVWSLRNVANLISAVTEHVRNTSLLKQNRMIFNRLRCKLLSTSLPKNGWILGFQVNCKTVEKPCQTIDIGTFFYLRCSPSWKKGLCDYICHNMPREIYLWIIGSDDVKIDSASRLQSFIFKSAANSCIYTIAQTPMFVHCLFI